MSQMSQQPQSSQPVDRAVRRPEWVAHVLDGEHAVLLHLPSAKRVALSPEATAIWSQIVAAGPAGTRTGDIVAALAPRYDVEPTIIESDVRQLLDDLLNGEWVEEVEPDSPAAKGGDAR